MMNRITELKELKRLLIKYLEVYNPETDCYEKWMETVQDEVRELLKDGNMIHLFQSKDGYLAGSEKGNLFAIFFVSPLAPKSVRYFLPIA